MNFDDKISSEVNAKCSRQGRHHHYGGINRNVAWKLENMVS